MFTILLHSSKTMKHDLGERIESLQAPLLLCEADLLATRMKKLKPNEIKEYMKLSDAMAEKTYGLIQGWNGTNVRWLPAIDAFLGDIYSGLQAQALDESARQYANEVLYILSGQYGVLRALDAVQPYRLEMGYKIPSASPGKHESLYAFWGDEVARVLPRNRTILNLSAVEYTKAVLPYMHTARVITPRFLTISQKTGEPVFVTVHAKIARGAFARWVIDRRIEDERALRDFQLLGYRYSSALSTELEPVFIAQTFEGLGLSVRLT